MIEKPLQLRSIFILDPFESFVSALPHALLKPVRAHHWNKREREDKRADQGNRHGVRHRVEQLSRGAAQRVNRDVTGDNHGHGVENRAIDVLGRRHDYFLQIILLPFAETQFAVNVLNHYQRAIDDDPEVDGADREQICGHAIGVQKNEGEKQCERNRQSHDNGGAHADQKEDEHDEDQGHAQQEIVLDRGHRQPHQVASVVVGPHFYIGRKNMFVQFFGLFFHTFQNVLRLLAAEHQDDAFDNIVILVKSELAEARSVADQEVAHIANVHRHAILRTDNYAAYVRFVSDQTESANVVKLLSLRIKSAPGVRIIETELLNHGGNRDVISVESCGIEQDLILHYGSAESGIIRDSAHLLVLPLDYPVFECF